MLEDNMTALRAVNDMPKAYKSGRESLKDWAFGPAMIGVGGASE